MANTIMSAKNSFLEGLIMDFSPDNTQATCMTSALNATLLTFNGNEMQLLNDMGNGRVETAFLPEGYIPVGSCEFGDIIYIVSYNPLTNKSQIGCFPSPERNISSEEIGNMKLVLSYKDFLETDSGGNLTGKLKASSVKKVLFDSRDMTPGDKYIIYSTDLKFANNNRFLSDYGNFDHEHGRFPKLAKIHVVSIEESGKIVYLDSTTKWYDTNNYYLNADLSVNGEIKDLDSYRTLVSSAYSIFSSKVSGKLALLVELEKITGFSCSWTPYGKTLGDNTEYDIYWNFGWTTNDNNINPSGAIITFDEWTGPILGKEGMYGIWTLTNGVLHLDKNYKNINISIPNKEWEFSRHYKPENTITYSSFINTYEYNKYLNSIISSFTEIDLNKININRIDGYPVEGEYYVNCNLIINGIPHYQTKKGETKQGNVTNFNDDIVNNYFHYPIVKKFLKFVIPTKQTININGLDIEKEPDISNLIYHYKIAPTMPYGILEEFALEGYIDFSKIGKKNISLNTWKYYNYENTMTLTWGMEAYTEPLKGISEVVFEFYDNLGFVGAYHNKGKMSYNGVFTEYITLGESGSNYKFNNIPAFPDTMMVAGVSVPLPKYHKGAKVKGDSVVEGIVYLDDAETVITNFNPNDEYYQDDSATLYPNWLYLVKIITKYCDKNVLDEYVEPDEKDALIEYRWLWTNTLFNEYYYLSKDFKELLAQLSYDINALYSLKNSGELSSTISYKGNPVENNTLIGLTEYEQLAANVTYINQGVNTDADKQGNIKCLLLVGLLNAHNTFNIELTKLSLINVDIHLGRDYLEYQTPEIITNEEIGHIFLGINPINKIGNSPDFSAKIIPSDLGKILVEALGLTGGNTNKEINSSNTLYESYTNMFSVTFPTSLTPLNTEMLTYPPYLGECPEGGINTKKYNTPLDKLEYTLNNDIGLTLTGILYSKYYTIKLTLTTSALLVKPLLYSRDDLVKYNMDYDSGHFYLNNLMGLVLGNDLDGDDQHVVRLYKLKAATDSSGLRYWNLPLGNNLGDDGGETKAVSRNIFEEFLACESGNLNELFPGITPIILVDENGYGSEYNIVKGLVSSNEKIVNALAIGVGKYNSSFRGKNTNYVGVNNSLSNLNSINTYLFFMLKDSEDIVHILNTAIPVTYSNGRINLVVRGALSGTTIGDLIASVLMNLYYTLGDYENNVSYQGISNFVKLGLHTYTYVKDIIFKLGTTNNNDLIVMLNIHFPYYLKLVIEHTDLGLDKNSQALMESDTNVNFSILSISKNCPMQISYNYIDPIQELNLAPNEIIKVSDGSLIYTNLGFINNRLYILNIKELNNFKRLDSSQSFEYYSYKDFKESNLGLFTGTRETELLLNDSFKKGFSYALDLLVCKKTNSNSAHSGNSLSISGLKSSEGWGSIWPIYLDENLLIEGKLG